MPVASPSPGADVLRRDPSLLDDVFGRLADRVSSGAIPSAALAVGDAQGGIRKDTFFSSTGRSISADSYFFLASVTKPIVATAFMHLVEDGLVNLRDPLVKFIPDFANAPGKADVTPWHLLTHTSGVRDYPIEDIRRKRPSAADMTQAAVEAPLAFAPGTRYSYCSTSFLLLTRLIEKLTGKTHVAFLRERILDPLGMETTYDPRGSKRPIVAVEGVGVDSRLMRFIVLRYLAGIALPGGGLFGTLDDLLRFGAATLQPRREGDRWVPLSPALIEEMQQDQLPAGVRGDFDGEDRPIHFGIGWGKPTLMRPLPGSNRVVSHGGASGTRIWIDPDADLVIVYFTNQWSADRGPESEAIEGIYAALGSQPAS
jgi:CubicO group peptidase (beta-lactamase class C family)